MKKIVFIFGTRPEAIKMAPVINKSKNRGDLEVIVLITAQHREMLDNTLNLFNIIPEIDLNIMKPNQTLSDITSVVISKVSKVLEELKPNCVLVHGDTTTTFAASLAAFYNKIPVAHVEAGLRTNNFYSPWPEEMNRTFVGKLSKIHFAPTLRSKKNLLEEGISEDTIHVTGNTVIDALFEASDKIENNKDLRIKLERQFSYLNKNKKLILMTGHRRENFGNGIESICEALKEIACKHDVEIIYPVHLNPNIKEPVERILKNVPNIFLIEPLDYLPFIYIMKRCSLILTDSGGVQEEAPSLGKPVIVLRETTERPEAVDAGTVVLTGTNKENIVKITSKILTSQSLYEEFSKKINPYGDGKSSEKIIELLIKNMTEWK